jgi:UDP-N-acetylmuramate dehydrogenase
MMVAKRPDGLRGTLKLAEPLARHTTWRVGGPADCFYEAADFADLVDFLRHLPSDQSLTWLGLGSNVLVRDGGVRGAVISTAGALANISLLDHGIVRVEAGVACAKVAKFCAGHELVGGEFFAGIPGTMGGALAMNAGAFGGETWPLVESVETVDRHGNIRERNAGDFHFGYREVQGPPGEWFVAARLRFAAGNGQESRARIKQLLESRNLKQPTGVASCGSVFRNPEGDFAGRLIEACGLKGHCVGGACVSPKHANFIINTGNASAADIENLIEFIMSVVCARFGVKLQPEVRTIGERV